LVTIDLKATERSKNTGSIRTYLTSVREVKVALRNLLVVVEWLNRGYLLETKREGKFRAHGYIIRGKGPGYYPGRDSRPKLGL